MAKKTKRTCWVLKCNWCLYSEKDSSVELFSSLTKAQEALGEQLREDFHSNIDRFDTFYFDGYDDNIIPAEAITGNLINCKYVYLSNEYSEDYIEYTIEKTEIK